ncbi:MAG: sulfotransferase family 2 domain-containing protein [Pseudomonadota bacterium]
MIISPGRRYVFVHIPKTAGTSFALALEDRAKKDDILIGDTPKAIRRRRRVRDAKARGRLWKHSTLRDIDGLVALDDLKDMFTFTLVRNPWDRAVSYYHWLRTQRFDHPSVKLSKELAFSDFVCHPVIATGFRNSPAATYMRRVDGVEHCNAFVRIEAFEKDAAPVFEHLGFAVNLPHLNRSDRGPDYRHYYNAETADCLARACAEDIKRFNYSFE